MELLDPYLLFSVPLRFSLLSATHETRCRTTSVSVASPLNISRQTSCARGSHGRHGDRATAKYLRCDTARVDERWYGLHHIAKPIVKCDIAVCGNRGQPGQIFVAARRAKRPRGLENNAN